MKPLIRYTIGKVSSAGWDILSESIRIIRKLYPEFDLIVCYNCLNPEEVEVLKELRVDLFDQQKDRIAFNFKDDDEGLVRNFGWKLVPFRLRPQAHELWVDNDIVIRERIPEIDNWLNSDTGIISRGFNYDYGIFSNDLDLCLKGPFCAGFFGLPPNFDLAGAVQKYTGGSEMAGFDEQGLVAKIVSNIPNYVAVRHNQLALLTGLWKPQSDFWFPNGIHFARANRWANHTGWGIYKKAIMP